MSSQADQINLDLCLAQAANPLDQEVKEEIVSQLMQLVKNDKETIGFVLRFFGHKFQSPHELEALKALNVIQTLVKRCDRKFIEEIGKFRFLNEMIKVISPKYLGSRSPEKVKRKIIELLYLWSIELKHEPKIFEAYQMLKRQGIISSDPNHLLPDTKPMPPPPPRPKDEIWDNVENSLTLKRLIQSGQPEDRVAANKLIKMLAQQADKKTEIKSRCQSELELARNNARLFSEVLANFSSPGESNFTEKDLLDELYESCKKLRPKLFKLAGELPETESLFEELLKVNDELTKVINEYDVKMQSSPESGREQSLNHNAQSGLNSNLLLDNSPVHSKPVTSNNNLIDISLFTNDYPSTNGSTNNLCTSESTPSVDSSAVANSQIKIANLSDDILLSDHFSVKDNSPNPNGLMLASASTSLSNNHITQLFDSLARGDNVNQTPFPVLNNMSSKTVALLDPLPSSSTSTIAPTSNSPSKTFTSCLDELENLMRVTLNAGPKPEMGDLNIPLNAMKVPGIEPGKITSHQKPVNHKTNHNITANDLSDPDDSNLLSFPASVPSTSLSPAPITDIFVPLESILPGDRPPITLVNLKEIKSILNFGSNQPRPDLSVAVLTTTNLSNKIISKISFTITTASKDIQFKYQAPSATTLNPSSPFLPPSAITQVIIFAKTRLTRVEPCRFRLEYSMEAETFTSTGEVDL